MTGFYLLGLILFFGLGLQFGWIVGYAQGNYDGRNRTQANHHEGPPGIH